MLCNRKKPINEEMQINTIIAKAWTTYFRNLYRGNSKERLETNEESNRTMMEDEYYDITLRNVKKAIENSKN
jgi:ppGpp synthetase/RelA/SpoT-type nucleotidyltranferase